jgi:hypothetical protein
MPWQNPRPAVTYEATSVRSIEDRARALFLLNTGQMTLPATVTEF